MLRQFDQFAGGEVIIEIVRGGHKLRSHAVLVQIHYFVRGPMTIGHWRLPGSGGSRESADIAEWVETHYTPLTVDRVIIYDLTQPPRNS